MVLRAHSDGTTTGQSVCDRRTVNMDCVMPDAIPEDLNLEYFPLQEELEEVRNLSDAPMPDAMEKSPDFEESKYSLTRSNYQYEEIIDLAWEDENENKSLPVLAPVLPVTPCIPIVAVAPIIQHAPPSPAPCDPEKVQKNNFNLNMELMHANLEKVLEDHVEKCKKALEPILDDMIRVGVTKLTSRVVKRVIEPEVIDLSDDEKPPIKKEAIPECKPNRRFNKIPTKVKLENTDDKQTREKTWMVRKKPEQVKSGKSKVKKHSLKIRMKRKKKSSQDKETEWVIKNLEASPEKPQPETVYVCELCDFYDCVSETTFKSHLVTHREAQFICGICSKKFYTKSDLVPHVRTHGPSRSYIRRSTKLTVSQVPQRECSRKSYRQYCVHCPKSYVNKRDLDFHCLKFHPGLKSNP